MFVNSCCLSGIDGCERQIRVSLDSDSDHDKGEVASLAEEIVMKEAIRATLPFVYAERDEKENAND